MLLCVVLFASLVYTLSLQNPFPTLPYSDDVQIVRFTATTTGTASVVSDVQGNITSVVVANAGLVTFPNFTLIQSGHRLSFCLSNDCYNVNVTVIPRNLNIGWLITYEISETKAMMLAYHEFKSRNLATRDILPGITVGLPMERVECSVTLGTSSFYQMVTNRNVVAVVGPDCSSVAKVIGTVAGAFEIPLISGNTGNADLSNKKLFKYFFRTVGTSKDEGLAFVTMFVKNGWKDIVVMTLDAYPFPQEFYQALTANGIRVHLNLIMSTGQASFLSNLRSVKESGYKIIICYIYDGIGGNKDLTKIIREADSIGLFDEDYVWLWSSGSPSTFDNLATDQNLRKKLNGTLAPDILDLKGQRALRNSLVNLWNTLNLTAAGFDTSIIPGTNFVAVEDTGPYLSLDANTFGVASYYIDAWYAVLRSIHDIIFNQKVALTGPTLLETMKTIHFEGMSGNVSFNQFQDRPNTMILKSLVYSSTVNNSVPTYRQIMLSNYGDDYKTTYTPINDMIWRNGKSDIPKPFDCPSGCGFGSCIGPSKCNCSTGYIRDVQSFASGGPDCTIAICKESCNNGKCVSPDVCQCLPTWKGERCNIHDLPVYAASYSEGPFAALVSVNSLILVFNVAAIILTVKNRDAPVFKASDVHMSILGYAGNALLNVSNYLRINYDVLSCTGSFVLLHIGLTLLLSSSFLKNWRIYAIFTKASFGRFFLKNTAMFLSVIGFLLIDAILLIVLMAVNSPVVTNIDTGIDAVFYRTCNFPSNSSGSVVSGLLAVYKLFLLLLLFFVGFKTSSLPGKFNHSATTIRSATSIMLFGIIYVILAMSPLPGSARSHAISDITMVILGGFFFLLASFQKKLRAVYEKTMLSGHSKSAVENRTSAIQRSELNGSIISATDKQKMDRLYKNAITGFHLAPGFFSRWTMVSAILDSKSALMLVKKNEAQLPSSFCFVFEQKDKDFVKIGEAIEDEKQFQSLIIFVTDAGVHKLLVQGEKAALHEWLGLLRTTIGAKEMAMKKSVVGAN
jgi:hypothetical protein